MNPAHRQIAYLLRHDWGLWGAAAVAADVDVAVVVDVLSFTTTVSVAADAGIAVLPYRCNDAGAERFARHHDAALAVGRSVARPGEISLSPASVLAADPPPTRLVLPSPNGSTIAHHLDGSTAMLVAACLRNATAVAAWISKRHPPDGAPIAIVSAGERWPDGSLRPCVEDWWGAGALFAALCAEGWTDLSPEAAAAVAAYQSVQHDLPDALLRCASGRELAESGYAGDVKLAADVDGCNSVPVLTNGAFRASR